MSRSPARPYVLIGLMLCFACSCTTATSNTSSAGDDWWSHIEVLASDELAGRETGTEGYRRAAEYVAAQFEAFGVQPGNAGSFFQTVRFVGRSIREDESSLALVRGGETVPLELGEDATLSMRVTPSERIDAPLVFVGYGLKVPEIGHDDFQGLDLRGKVAVYVQGAPGEVTGVLAAHVQSSDERWAAMRAAGAIGRVYMPNPKHTDVPWERSKLNRFKTSLTLADAELERSPGLRFTVSVNADHAEKWFAGSGHTFAEMLELADQKKPLPRFPLAFSVRARQSWNEAEVESDNVVGIIPGADPQLKNEYVVLSGHLDHLGIGGAVNGDSIYNGAIDNASGIATMIELARMAQAKGVQFKRSLILLPVTGEEKGLLGSRYYAARPTVPRDAIVACINMDMYQPIVPFKHLIVYGEHESDLGPRVPPIAENYDVAILEDPQPERNVFIRSDQYSFIKQGIPSLSFKIGGLPDSPEERVMKDWIHDRYHAPSDDLAQPVNREAAVTFTNMLFDICVDIANSPGRPRWNDDSFFRRFAAPGPS